MNSEMTYSADPCKIARLDPPRELRAREIRLLKYLLAFEFDQKAFLESNLELARVTEEHDNCPGIVFVLEGGEGAAGVPRKVLLEAEGRDGDGTKYKLLLLSLGQLTYELEFFRGDLGPFLAEPDIFSLVVEPRR